MGLVLFLVCLAFPLLEIAVLVKVGQAFGLLITLALLIGMAALGLTLLRWQGWASFNRMREAILRGEAPVRPMLDGLLLTLAGTLFLVPGFISDAMALLLLIPAVRRIAGDWFLSHSTMVYSESATQERRQQGSARGGPIIEGEFERLDERPVDRGSQSRNGAGPA